MPRRFGQFHGSANTLTSEGVPKEEVFAIQASTIFGVNDFPNI